MSANHAVFNVIFRFVENYVSPVAGRISSQRHVMAIRDGFISVDALYDCRFVPAGFRLPAFFSGYHMGGLPARGWIWRNSLKAKSSRRLI